MAVVKSVGDILMLNIIDWRCETFIRVLAVNRSYLPQRIAYQMCLRDKYVWSFVHLEKQQVTRKEQW